MSYGQIIDFLEAHLLPCAVKQVTGLCCPGCGMQTAFIALLRGDLLLSLTANPALIPCLFTLGYAGLHIRADFRNGARNTVILFCSTAALMIVNYIARVADLW